MSTHERQPAAPYVAPAGQAVRHESAHLHVSGRALYCDDIALPANTLHAAFGVASIPHGKIRSMNLDAVRAEPGVVATQAGERRGHARFGAASARVERRVGVHGGLVARRLDVAPRRPLGRQLVSPIARNGSPPHAYSVFPGGGTLILCAA